MSSISINEFLDLLKRSALLEDQVYNDALQDIKQNASNSLTSANLLAGEFIKRNLLTPWHVRQLLKRKYKGFYLRQYKILGHLGSGGMSSVYLGEHTVMKRLVAIKVLPKRRLNPTYLDRFAREAQAIASLDSQHVVRAYDVDRYEDVHYIVMEYFEGQNLRQLVEKEGPLDFEDAANYIRQAALGLSDAHKSGVIHRDVKPENIVVDERGFVKILDLGLALLDENAFNLQGTLFDEDKILGTADYLAPEQALDSHNVDARVDVYGLGATLYFCLVGAPPFPFGSISERLLAHQRKEPTSIFIERPDAPADLVDICSKMMAKKPENRIQSANEVADLMQRWLIKHGFSQPVALSASEEDKLTGDLQFFNENNFFAIDENATEIGSERKDNVFRTSDAELSCLATLKNEHSVDLFDLSESGTSISKLQPVNNNNKSTSDNIVLSKSSMLSSSLDPFELALNEIADSTKVGAKTNLNSQNSSFNAYTRLQQKQTNDANSTANRQSSLHLNTQQPNATTQAIYSKSLGSSTIDPKQPEFQSNPSAEIAKQHNRFPHLFDSWSKDVPIWFWTVAIGGYALAIFLAGILFTLLLNIK